MFFQLKELVRLLGITVFEIWIALVCFIVFTILLTVKVDHLTEQPLSWWTVFTPLFVGDALNAYFCVIVFIRMNIDGSYKSAVSRAVWSGFMIVTSFIFKFFLCQKLNGENFFEYSGVTIPVFILLNLLALRACHSY